MSKCWWIGNLFMKNKFWKKVSQCRKNERGIFGIFQHPSYRKTPKKMNGGSFGEKLFSEKSHSAEKTKRGDPLVSSGIVCYAGNFFGSVPWANGGNLKFCRILVELFWSLQVYRKFFKIKKHWRKAMTIVDSYQEKHRLKIAKDSGLKQRFRI